MNNKKIWTTILAATAAITPVVAVVSCGNQTTQATINNMDQSVSRAFDAAPQPYQSYDEPTIEVLPGITNISEYKASISVFETPANAAHLIAKTFRVGGISNHTVDFALDEKIGMSSDQFKTFIHRFIKETNYGYGWLKLKRVLFTNQKLSGKDVVGYYSQSTGEDITIHIDDLQSGPNKSGQTWEDYNKIQNGQKLELGHHAEDVIATWNYMVERDPVEKIQIAFDTLKHEMGHLETTAIFKNYEQTTSNLIGEKIIGSTMFKNTNDWSISGHYVLNPARAAAEKERLDARVRELSPGNNASILPNLLGSILNPMLAKDLWPDQYNKDYQFDMAYHMGDHMEFLNRVMNIIELTPWDEKHPETMYHLVDTLKYQIGEAEKLINADGTLTEAAHKLVEAYGKYVYGYLSYGMHREAHYNYTLQNYDYNLRGFADSRFDFVRITGKNRDGSSYDKHFPLNVVRTHYIDKERMFGQPRSVYAGYAYDFEMNQNDLPWTEATMFFYEDQNHDGIITDNEYVATFENKNADSGPISWAA